MWTQYCLEIDELVAQDTRSEASYTSQQSSVSSKMTQQSNYSSMSSAKSVKQQSLISNNSSVKTLKDSSYSTASSIASSSTKADFGDGNNLEVPAYQIFKRSLEKNNMNSKWAVTNYTDCSTVYSSALKLW